jgi:hypothetical protein
MHSVTSVSDFAHHGRDFARRVNAVFVIVRVEVSEKSCGARNSWDTIWESARRTKLIVVR